MRFELLRFEFLQALRPMSGPVRAAAHQPLRVRKSPHRAPAHSWGCGFLVKSFLLLRRRLSLG